MEAGKILKLVRQGRTALQEEAERAEGPLEMASEACKRAARRVYRGPFMRAQRALAEVGAEKPSRDLLEGEAEFWVTLGQSFEGLAWVADVLSGDAHRSSWANWKETDIL